MEVIFDAFRFHEYFYNNGSHFDYFHNAIVT